MTEENKETLDAEVQDVDTSVDNEGNDTLKDDGNSDESEQKYLNAKKRAEKAEADKKELQEKLKQLTEEPKEANEEEKPQPTGLSRDEAILFAKGLSKEEVEKASKIAEFEGINLTEAVDSDIFTIWKEKKDKEAKSEKAQLGASSGSPKVEKQKDFTSKELTPEEHKELWKQKNSK